MPIVWCSISAHGFGHAAQIIPILNELGKMVKDLQVILRTCVSSSLFEEHLRIPWEIQAVPQDIGCIQQGPLDIDLEGTWRAHQEFHENWDERVIRESNVMSRVKPNLVISNISYLAIASAVKANCPVIAIASLSWDRVLEGLVASLQPEQRLVIEHIKREYGKAHCLMRLNPGIDMPSFISMAEVNPSFPLGETSSKNLHKFLGLTKNDKLVLIAFGGVPLRSLPLKQMDLCKHFHFLVSGVSFDSSYTRIHRVDDCELSFGEIMRQVDVVMTKPGYATIVSAVHYGIPVVYVRRHNFVDEPTLIDYAHKYGRARELARKNFESGEWEETLQLVLTEPMPQKSPPQPDPAVASGILKTFLKNYGSE